MEQDDSGYATLLAFVAAGAILVGLLGFGVDTLLAASGLSLAAQAPLSGVTSYNFTLLGALVGGVLGGFAGIGLV
jgi:hypothetical protein